MNPTTNSYKRFGSGYAPQFVNWSFDNRAQLIRIPRAQGIEPRIEIRSADACCNPYITFKLILAAGIEGIESGDFSLLDRTMKDAGSKNSDFKPLPTSLREAVSIAESSAFVTENLEEEVRSGFFEQLEKRAQEYEKASDKDAFDEKAYFNFI